MGDSGEADRAWERCLEGEALLDQVGDTDRWGSVRGTSPRTMLLLRSGRPDDVLEAEALANDEVANPVSDIDRAHAWLRLGLVRSALGRDDVADAYRELTALARRLDDPVFLALTLNNLVEEDLRTGRTAQAAVHQREALAYGAELGMEHLATFGLIIAARMAEAKRSDGVAARLHAFAESRLAAAGIQLFPEDRDLSDAMLARAAARLGETAYADARREAESMTTEEALNEADAILAAAAGAPD